MKENKSYLTTKKKLAVAIAVAALILIAVGTGTVLAVGSYNQSSAIGEANARNFAFLDAGIDPAEAILQRTEFDYEQGQFVYEVEFTHEGTEYEYWVKASDGSIVKKESELTSPIPVPEAAQEEITLEKAKEIALADAGVKADGVTFTEGEIDSDDGNRYFKVEFQTDDTEFEYEIDRTGHIYSKSKEIRPVSTEPKPEEAKPVETESKKEDSANAAKSESKKEISSEAPKAESKKEEKKTTTSSQIGLEDAKKIALADAGVSAKDATFLEAKTDKDDGKVHFDLEFKTKANKFEYEIDKTGRIIDKSKETLPVITESKPAETTSTTKQKSAETQSKKEPEKTTASAQIGLEGAKSIAVKRAGLSLGSVTFTKAKLENDDGKIVYELEFYKGSMEYECEVNAKTGKVIDYDSECEVCDRDSCSGKH